MALSRMVDYKSGKLIPSNLVIENWDEVFIDRKKSKMKSLQLMFYAMAYRLQEKKPTICAAMIPLRVGNADAFPLKFGKGAKAVPLINSTHYSEFEDHIKAMIKEIQNPNIAFIQTED